MCIIDTNWCLFADIWRFSGRILQKEFDSIQQSRNVVAKLNELESLVSEAERRRREAGRDGVDPPVP